MPGFTNFPLESFSQSSSHDACTLSPSAAAFSSMLSAFIGSIINGLVSGWFIAFMTGWLSWFALFRVLVGGIYMFYRSVTKSWGPRQYNETLSSGIEDGNRLISNDDPPAYDLGDNRVDISEAKSHRGRVSKLLWPPAADIRAVGKGLQYGGSKGTRPKQGTTILGWVGWVYGAVYAPITQTIWIAANLNQNLGAAKLVKGLTIAITALPLSVDCRLRYADSLKQEWARTTFNLVNSASCILQGVYSAILMIYSVIDMHSSFGFPWPLVFILPVFAMIWMFVSFVLLPMRDGPRLRAANFHWAGIFLDVGMGAFAGIFLAAPAFGLYMNAQFNKQISNDDSDVISDLGTYLNCETQFWRKFAAVAP